MATAAIVLGGIFASLPQICRAVPADQGEGGSMAQWYYARDGQQQGPVEEQALKQMLSSGELQLTEMVWREGMGNWQPASQVQEFAGLGQARPQAAAPGAPHGGYPVAPATGFAPTAAGE